jgi:hypothetical protein
MKLKWLLMGVFALTATAAFAQSGFGVHLGYFGQNLKAAYVGADFAVPIGPVAIIPTLDYSKKSGVGYWFGSADVDLRNPLGTGPQWWAGAGPTYGYWKFGGSSSGGNRGYGSVPGATVVSSAASTSGTFKEWGWDVNGGIGFSTAALKPYVTARYTKIKGFKTTGAAIGLRF